MKCRAQPHPKHRMISNGDVYQRVNQNGKIEALSKKFDVEQ
jgi:hypothetical protein